MAKKTDKLFKNPNNIYYTKIVEYRGRGFGFFVALCTLTALTSVVIFLNFLADGSWLNIVIPSSLIGLLTLAYPPTETWLYRPWQAQAQQVERHFYDN